MPFLSSRRLVLLAGLLAAVSATAAPPEPTEREREQLQLYQNPNGYFLERLKAPQENVDGSLLHPKIQYYAETRGRTAAGKETARQQEQLMETEEGRAKVREAVDRTWTYRTKITAEMEQVQDMTVDGRGGPIPVRVYKPKVTQPGPLPLLVYFHGGAWLFGSVDAVDRAVRLIANEAQVIVVSVNYRLAPEHLYPAQQDDAQDAFRWAAANAAQLGADPKLLAVGGDSAGGQLAIVTSMRQRDAKQTMPLYQMLYYPAVDMHTKYRSFELFAEGYGLDRHLADFVFAKVYATEKLRNNPEVSPLLAPSLKNMPATIVATAGYDIIRDQGRALAKRLEKEGVSTVYLNYGSLTHGFMQHSGTIDDAERACVQTAQLLGAALRSRAALKAG